MSILRHAAKFTHTFSPDHIVRGLKGNGFERRLEPVKDSDKIVLTAGEWAFIL
jgi:hypothetical protein